MGYPGKNHKAYQTPKRPFEKTRIETETRLVIEYGLRNKRGSFDWTLGPGVQVFREATGADYGLFTYVRDSYASGGRTARGRTERPKPMFSATLRCGIRFNS